MKVLIIFILIAFLLGCGGGGGDSTPTTTTTMIINLTANPDTVDRNQGSTITVTASDPAGGQLSYSWTATGGQISGAGPTITWIAPNLPGNFIIIVTVTTDKGRSESRSISIKVKEIVLIIINDLNTYHLGRNYRTDFVKPNPYGLAISYYFKCLPVRPITAKLEIEVHDIDYSDASHIIVCERFLTYLPRGSDWKTYTFDIPVDWFSIPPCYENEHIYIRSYMNWDGHIEDFEFRNLKITVTY